MRHLYLRLPLVCAASVGLTGMAGEALATRYERKTDLRLETTVNQEFETVAFEMTIDGEPQQGRGGGGTSKETRRSVLLDRTLALEGGKPTQVRRRFETLEGEGESVMGERTFEFETESELDGLVLELTNKGGEVEARVLEGSAPSDDAALLGHRLELALDAFLPEAGSEETSWKLEKTSVLQGLQLDLAPVYFRRPPPEGGGGEGGGERPRGGGRSGRFTTLMQQADWTGEAKLGDAVEHEGDTCQVIELELVAEGETEDMGGFGGGRRGGNALSAAGASLATTYEIRLEGRLLFSTAKGLPVRLELEGSAAIETNTERETQRGQMSMHSRQEGKLEVVVTVSEVAREEN
jgi:hypothetical protein